MIHELPTTQETAIRMQQIMLEDYGRLDGIDPQMLSSIVSPTNEERVESQLKRLKKPRGASYLGLYDATYDGSTTHRQLRGFAKLDNWNSYDQRDFSDKNEYAHQLRRKILPRAIGLHAFALDNLSREEHTLEFLTNLFIQHVPHDKELRAAVDLEDEGLQEAFTILGAPEATLFGTIALNQYQREYSLRILPPKSTREA